MDSNKIGIVTFHAAENFGSALQAYALERVLKDKGYSPEIINCILDEDMKQYRLFRTSIYKERPRAFIGDILYLKRNIQRKISFKRFRSNYLKISTEIYHAGRDDLSCLNEKYDVFICGSDQIWNLNCTKGLVSDFFLKFVNDDKIKISYAPSMPTRVPERYYGELKKALKRFDAISVRENQTVEYLKNEVGVENDIIKTVDPTLLLDARVYIDTFKLVKENKKYIFVYILPDAEKVQDIIDYANKTAKKTGLKIRYVFMRKIKEFANQEYLLGIGPREFLQQIYNATYLITNSFHATVFSLQFEVPFCVFQRSGSKSRMIELLTALDMRKNIYFNDNDMEWMHLHSDENTKKRIRELAQESMKFLLGNIKRALHEI